MSADKLKCMLQCPICNTSHLPSNGNLKHGVYASTCGDCGHFFKFKVTTPIRSKVNLTINGKQYTVDSKYDPATSLNEFMRDTRVSMGTKYMCREGGCGICVVMVTKKIPGTDIVEHLAINSCLCPVYMCDDWNITTIEGLGNLRDGLHPVQSRLNQYNGSQCGFCSPAQIMNMYTLLQKNDKPSKQMIEDSYDGILCRCTGYRSILDAMKSFGSDNVNCTIPHLMLDIEDLATKSCKKSGKKCEGLCANDSVLEPVHMVLKGSQWFKPTTMDQLYDLLSQYKDSKMRLVFGCTGSGVYKDIGPWMYDVLIDLHGISQLYHVHCDESLKIGANITISQMIDLFKSEDLNDHGLPYIKECAKFMKRIAHTNVRNAGSWAGNLMMKHQHPEFPSDMFVMLETVNAQIVVNEVDAMSPWTLMNTDMKGRLLTSMKLTRADKNSYIKLYKVAKRSQNCHSYVSAGFNFIVDINDNFKVAGRPSIVFAGIGKTFVHATVTETALTGKSLISTSDVAGALKTLYDEISPDIDPLGGSTNFRKQLAVNLLYRFVLHVIGDTAGERFRSGDTPLVRPLSSGTQSYDTHKQEWPLTEPLLKVEGKAQVTGEAVYTNDIPPIPGELFAAFAVTDVGSATITHIDISTAQSIAGVAKVLVAKDIPGVNNTMPPPYVVEELLCSNQVMYAGQAVAIVIADNPETASSAARAIKVSYSDIKRPVIQMEEAVKLGMVFPRQADDIVVGDAEGAISKSAYVISGNISCGTQYHYPMETQISICRPTEDGMKIYTSSQWIDYAQKSVAQVLGVPCASIDIEVKRLGGAFGSKITRNFAISSGCALAAKTVNKPVRLAMDLHTNMEMVGKRFPYLAEYTVGFTSEGKLSGIAVTFYCDCGYAVNDCTLGDIMQMADNAYFCPNWHMTPVAVQTNTPNNTYCRAPASTPGIFIMETIMEHISTTLSADPTHIRQINLYSKGQVTPGGMTLTYCSISSLLLQLESSAGVQARKQEVALFNKANRWKKKGLSVVPLKYGVPWTSHNFGCNVAIYDQDGTVAISHGGIEVGQGINTKAIQVCAFEFGIPVNMIKVKATNTLTSAGSCYTGSSVTSELVCQSVIKACQELLARMAPVKEKLQNPTWLQIVGACYKQGVDLATHAWCRPHSDTNFRYNSYGVTCTEVELDVLTGEHQISRVDLLLDCGESINPFLDIGQVEGAFVMGLGYWLFEESIYDITTGQYLTNGTWDYKPPTSKDIPIDFRIQLLKDAPNPIGVLRAKACGEPPLCMSCSALFALKHAVQDARREIGLDAYFPLNGPATVEVLQQACQTDIKHLVIN